MARLTSIDETRLPIAPFSSSARTDTGTMATSGASSSSPRSSNQRRSAPAHSASTTSFTFTSWWALMALTAGSDSDVAANTR